MERYESLGPVGEGSYGTVTKCRHRDSGRLVAIKKFVDSDDDKTVKKIALREINLLRQLRHDNLVNLLEVWKRRRRWYLVFEFVDRTLLDDLEQNPNGLDLNTCRQYLFQILRAADFCHQQNVIHRDIKPENTLISQGGVVKLCDFGFARTITSPSEGGVYTDYVATRWYRAPELLVGDIKYGKPVDIWALGCLLIEMLTGQPLFPGDSDLDQIYHIVRCFGNLMTHHQELFYRNPVFSGVKLPECSSRVPLQQRFPAVSPTALDLAQRCLEMDPEGRAQCLELLEHPLFTQDSFHVRFLEEFNAKIQKEHRENSTLPKITQTPGQEKEKDKKQSEDIEEQVNKDKNDKTKGKPQIKLSKHVHNPTESLMPKQHKTYGNKNINPVQNSIKTKPERSSGPELTESEIFKSNKSIISRSADETNTTPNLKKKNSVVVKPKHERILSPEPRKDHLQSVKDLNYSGPDNEKNMTKNRSFSKYEPNPEFTRSKPNIKEPKLPKNPNRDHQSFESSVKTESDVSLAPKSSHLLSNDPEVPAALSQTKSCKLGTFSELHTNQQETEQRTSESPKVIPKNQKTFKTTSDSGTTTNIYTSSPKTLPVDLNEPGLTEPGPAHKTDAPTKGVPNLKVSKPGGSSKTQFKDKDPEDKAIKRSHGYLKMKTVTETPGGLILLPQASAGDPEPSDSSFNARQTTKTTSEERSTLTSGMNKKLSAVLKVSEKENQEDLTSLLVSINPSNNPLMIQTSKVSGSSSSNKRNNMNESHSDSLKVPHTKQKPSKTGSFRDHMMSTETLKTQKPLLTPDSRNKSDKQDTPNIRDLTLIVSVDHKASSRDFPLHLLVSTDLDDLEFNAPQTSTSSPPLQPSCSAVVFPQTSQTLIPSLSVFSSSSPAARDLIQGAGVHPGTTSLRCVDKSKNHGGTHDRKAQQFTAGSLTCQAPENSQVSKNKSHVHFPDVRSSVLELRGKEGKHKSFIKNLRRDKHPSSPPSDVHLQGQNRDTNKH